MPGVKAHPFRRGLAPAAALLVLLVLAAYIPAMRGGFIWDDDEYVTENMNLRSPEGLRNIWLRPRSIPQYYPLVHTAFWIEYHVWGLNPAGYHVVNILLHAGNAALLWLILRMLAVPGAFLAAAVFALHPVQVESVAWITERKNVMSGLFCLASAAAYLRWRSAGWSERSRPPGERGRTWYALSLALFAAALLSKTTAAMMPPAILVVLWWRRGRLEWKDVASLAPMAAAGAAMGLLTVKLELYHVGAAGEDWSLSLPERFMVAGRAVWFYLGKLLWPADLSFIYPRWTAGGWLSYLSLPALALAAAWLWVKRGTLGRGPLAALLFFVVVLFPALGFFNVFPMKYSFVADHFQYLASIGPLVAAAAGVAGLSGRLGVLRPGWEAGGFLKKARCAAAVALVAVLAAMTWSRQAVYADQGALWRDTMTKNPGSWLAYLNMGSWLANQNRLDEAKPLFDKALALNGREPLIRVAMGLYYVDKGKAGEAAAQFEEAVRLIPDKVRVHTNLGDLLFGRGWLAEAEAHYREALRADPGSAAAHGKLGLALSGLGRREEAMGHFRRAVEIEPGSAEARYNLGVALDQAGSLPEAVRQYREAVRLSPGFSKAHNNLGIDLAREGDLAAAVASFAEAARVDPGNTAARANLEAARGQLGR